jgi:hypothetical protein
VKDLWDESASMADIDAVASDLEWLVPAPFFFGASVLPLYLDDAALADEARPTYDVDVILVISQPGPAYIAESRLEQELRDRGWTDDPRPERKNIHAFLSPSGVPVDLVLAHPRASGAPTTEDWALRAAEEPWEFATASGRTLRIPTPAFYLACKIAASRNPHRWKGAYEAKDVEDISTLLAGCSRLLASVQSGPPDLQETIQVWAWELLSRETNYGRTAHELLLANVPRTSTGDHVSKALRALAGDSP